MFLLNYLRPDRDVTFITAGLRPAVKNRHTCCPERAGLYWVSLKIHLSR
ncbi:MAG: hypothetical protein LBP59_03750 [Planctomycetaceae bacterium]|nr:hypothetical protein [Planctomycetaceae bacterium]